MRESFKKENYPLILTVIEASGGSVDWILPVCWYLKNNYPEFRQAFVILRYDDDILKGNNSVKTIIDEVTQGARFYLSDFLPAWTRLLVKAIRPLNIISKLFSKDIASYVERKMVLQFAGKPLGAWVMKNKPAVIFKDQTKLSEYFELLYNPAKENGCRVIAFPSAPALTFADFMWTGKNVADLLKKSNIHFADYYVIDQAWDKAKFKDVEEKVVVTGTPKFDPDWIAYLKKRYRLAQQAAPVKNVLFLLKNEGSIIYKDTDFTKHLQEVIETVLDVTDYRIVLKPHPRQDMRLLSRVIRKYPVQRVNVRWDSVFQLIDDAQYVISLPSGVIFDALMMGKPVIEYYDMEKMNNILKARYQTVPKNSLGGLTMLDKEGRLTTMFRELKLVIGANNPQELKGALKNSSLEKEAAGHLRIKEIFTNNQAKNVADIVMQCLF